MRAAILLAALLVPAGASASNSSQVGVSALVVSSVRVAQEVGALKKIAAAGGSLYVLPIKGSASSYGGVAPSISVEGAGVSLRQSSAGASATSLEGDLRVYVPEGSEGRVVVTVLTDGAPPELRRRR
jgi:hypothetical protein